MYKVLLVDDEAIIREGIARMVPWDQLGLHLMPSCENAFEAMDSMVNEMPDILLSDIKMPRMSGLELIERALKLYPSLQTIVLSGYDEFEYAQKAIKLGVKEYLLKPCNKEELSAALTRVRDVLEERRESASGNMDNRSTQVKRLMKHLMDLGAYEAESGRLEERIKQIVEMEGYEGVFVETLISLVAETARDHQDPHQQLEMIQSIYNQDSGSIVGYAAGILHHIFASRKNKREFVEEMCKYIQEHYMDQSLSLQYVAENVVHMNADYIGKVFANDCGMKFGSYLSQVRMSHAKRLIREHVAMPFYEVADLTGYGDNPQYFSLMFKKICHMTPKEYRDSLVIKNTEI